MGQQCNGFRDMEVYSVFNVLFYFAKSCIFYHSSLMFSEINIKYLFLVHKFYFVMAIYSKTQN